jgi:hypothetical protein
MAMTLEEHLATLPSAQQWRIAWQMAAAALPIWEHYARTAKLQYFDGVVGMSHTVAPDLLARAVAEVGQLIQKPAFEEVPHASGRLRGLQAEFLDPIVALQDMDWELPRAVQCCFYAVSNLVDAAAGEARSPFGESMRYVVVNQAIDAIEQAATLTETEIRAILYQFGERA